MAYSGDISRYLLVVGRSVGGRDGVVVRCLCYWIRGRVDLLEIPTSSPCGSRNLHSALVSYC